MHKRLILIAGIPATGKSTFARRLSGSVNIPCFCKDDLNEVIGGTMAVPTPQDRKSLSAASVQVLLHIADELLAANVPVILESNFKPGEVNGVRRLIEKHACKTMTFVFSGDPGALFRRFAARDATDARAAIHKAHGLDDPDAFREAVLPLAEFDVGGIRIAVDATDFHGVDYDELVFAAYRFISDC